ncbi:hypothetical protein Tco_0861722 [Tanacetum coccineum]|uniref:Reverse transcriptase Ty1/copia-type domain-containing protein n=1 Tax=Tanacetum coccineum TaxID=301880 RepID=A0ABQ5BIM5_9ASTR
MDGSSTAGYDKSKVRMYQTAIKWTFCQRMQAPRSKDNINCEIKGRRNHRKLDRENNDAPIIEDWVSDDEDEVEPIPKVEKKTVIPTATKKEFVKPETPVRRSVSCPNVHKHMVPRAVLMKTGLKTVNTARPVNTVRSVNTGRPFSTARGFNVVKPSACWVWKPIKPNGASLSNSQLNDKGFVDSGCSRHMSGNIAHLTQIPKTLMEVMLPLVRSKWRLNYWQRIMVLLINKLILPGQKLILVVEKFDTSVLEFNTADFPKRPLVGPSPTSEDSHVENQEIELGNIPQSYEVPTTPHIRIHKDHPIEHVIGDVQSSVQTRRMKTSYSEKGFLKVSQALRDPAWVEAMQEELLQFKLQKVWILVDLPKGHRAIGHTQEEGIDYDKVFAPVARIEAIRIFLAYASYMGFNGLPNRCQKCLLCIMTLSLRSTKFNYSDVKSKSMPIRLEKPLVSRWRAADVMNIFIDSMIGSLIYLKDIQSQISCFASVCMCKDLGFSKSPISYHLAVKRIFRYLKEKPSMPLKETVVATSTTEAKYVAAASCCGQNFRVCTAYGVEKLILARLIIATARPNYSTTQRLSAEASTDDNGEVKINATIDGHSLSITEGSLRRHLKLADQDGITSIPNSEIFEQLALMGYHTDSDKLTFQKGAFSPQWRFLIHNILHCLSPKKTAWEQFSSNIAAAVICLATNRKYNFSRMIFEHMVSNISSPHKFLMYPRFIQICLDMQRHHLQQHSRTYHVPSLSMKVFNNMKRPTKGFSGQEVALFPTMLDVTEPLTSPSRITSSPSPSPDPSPSHSPDNTTAAASQPSPTQPSPGA